MVQKVKSEIYLKINILFKAVLQNNLDDIAIMYANARSNVNKLEALWVVFYALYCGEGMYQRNLSNIHICCKK